MKCEIGDSKIFVRKEKKKYKCPKKNKSRERKSASVEKRMLENFLSVQVGEKKT
jgi:hypothetical protein